MWLVGSSSSRTSACSRMARVRASFIFQPPDREPTGRLRILSSKPLASSFWMISSGELMSITWLSDVRKSNTVLSEREESMSCSTYTVLTSDALGNPSS
ncbi:hypothetical protein MT325_m746L [Paramecium bursaria chlorella virus MT325]|uniref:Uncharacterized protein m746L n=1 Tax=Paramecium bursaria Chlorella virus MT325 TaxID=346932 RepID=A7IVC6_PBCVM|nr:hypothetical protein MT325_m746L [Paramecium bursaria chlorella virus MT325]